LIPYRDEFGILREYEVDFIIRSKDKIYLVETKSDKDLFEQTVLLKAKAAHSWCLSASRVSTVEDITKTQNWEYLVLSEGIYKANSGLGFDMFVPICRELRNRMIERYDDLLPKR
jgi:type III restriction enzyme